MYRVVYVVCTRRVGKAHTPIYGTSIVYAIIQLYKRNIRTYVQGFKIIIANVGGRQVTRKLSM